MTQCRLTYAALFGRRAEVGRALPPGFPPLEPERLPFFLALSFYTKPATRYTDLVYLRVSLSKPSCIPHCLNAAFQLAGLAVWVEAIRFLKQNNALVRGIRNWSQFTHAPTQTIM